MPNFYVKRPQVGEQREGKRKNFAIQKEENGKFSVVKSSAIDAVNKKYQEGIVSYSQAEALLRKLIRNLEREAGVYKAPDTFHLDNQKILDQYWKEEYSHRNLADPDAAYGKLAQALRALGSVSILVGTQSEIQKACNQFKGNKQRMIVGKLNALLDFVKRKHEIRLTKNRAQRPKITYVNEAELEIVVKTLEDDRLKLLVRVLFYTGMRLGEAFAVDPGKIRPDRKTIYVDTQLTRDMEEKEPKWGSERSVYLIPPSADLIEEWSRVRGTFEVGRGALLKYLRSAAKRSLGRPITFKDLRHSYAIYLLKQGVSISLISQSLGNSETVCQRHYAGFNLNSDSIEAIDAILKKDL